MADLGKTGEGFEFFIPPASAGRAIAVGSASLFMMMFLLTPLLAYGLSGAFERVYENPVFWLLLLGFSPLVAFFLLLAFPPRSWRARLEIEHDVIHYVPVPPSRWMGEPVTALALAAQSRELLICRGSKDTYGGVLVHDLRGFPYGFRLILRSPDGQSRELKIQTGSRLSPHHAQDLIDGIASTTGLPVRLVRREVRDDGTIREEPWAPVIHSATPAALAKLAFAATPLLGGVVVGLLRASGSAAALIGVLLWLAQTAVVLIAARRSHQRSKLALLYWLTTAVTFAASYTVVFLITANILRVR